MSPSTDERPCYLCGGIDIEILHSAVPRLGSSQPSLFSVNRCRACGMARTSPLPSAAELQEIYEAGSYTWKPPSGLVGQAESRYRRALVGVDQLRMVLRGCAEAKGRELLDIGCGDGLLVAEARRAGVDAFGVDYPGTPRWPECDPAWKQSADIEALEQPSERWDVISMFHVLEHLRDPLSVLRRVRRWLRPGGALVVQVPNFASAQARLFGARWYGLDIPRHLSHFSPSTLTRILAEGGFEMRHMRHLSWRDNGPMVASSLLIGLDPRIERERMGAQPRGAPAALARRLAYFATTWGATPLVLGEAMMRSGGTITAIARRAAVPP